MADLKDILDVMALTHAFTGTLDGQDSLETGQATRAIEGDSQSRLRTKQLLPAQNGAQASLVRPTASPRPPNQGCPPIPSPNCSMHGWSNIHAPGFVCLQKQGLALSPWNYLGLPCLQAEQMRWPGMLNYIHGHKVKQTEELKRWLGGPGFDSQHAKDNCIFQITTARG